jgi:hypothetical protein
VQTVISVSVVEATSSLSRIHVCICKKSSWNDLRVRWYATENSDESLKIVKTRIDFLV